MKNYKKSKCEIKYITIIVRMPGKMRAALNLFLTRRHEDEKAKLHKKFGHL